MTRKNENIPVNNLPEMKWVPMVALSLAFHLGIFLAVMIIPDSIPAKHLAGVIYEVDLVTLSPPGGSIQPGPAVAGPRQSGPASEGRPAAVPTPAEAKDSPTRIISAQPREEKPLIVAKKTLDTKKITPPPKTLSSTELIDQAISKIEKRVQKEEQGSHLERAVRELEKKAGESGQTGSGTGAGSGPGRGTGSGVAGISTSIYQMEVETRIKSNWSYPVALRDSDTLEATLVIRVRNTGEIIHIQFKKRSSDSTFNDSVLKAIERSDPLPPFPETFRKREEEIEINFNLRDLEA